MLAIVGILEEIVYFRFYFSLKSLNTIYKKVVKIESLLLRM